MDKPGTAAGLIAHPSIEVSSASAAAVDLLDKKAQYARAGIPLYLVVALDTKYDIEEVHEFRLDAHAAEYRLHRLHRDGIVRREHVVLGDISFADLVR
ncbi:Uma2 family endonuclease [Nocardia sp. NPDC049526]|uniref:Uma2 family endonuclease n=1 Tax=Nocardia sp. NPDC049526 TaxID=3364316 RepID=UPI00378E6F31